MSYKTLVSLSFFDRNINYFNQIHYPTLIIYGAQDHIRSHDEAIELVHSIPNSDIHMIETTSHIIPLEQLQKLATLS